MNIYEQKKLADEWREHYVDKDEFPPHLPKTSKARLMWMEHADGADRNYTRHCRNNFLKALEALKEEHDSVTYCTEDRSTFRHDERSCKTCLLIKELETT